MLLRFAYVYANQGLLFLVRPGPDLSLDFVLVNMSMSSGTVFDVMTSYLLSVRKQMKHTVKLTLIYCLMSNILKILLSLYR